MSQTISVGHYDEIIEKINELIKYYEKALENNKYSIKLANGDNINLTFPRNHIAHLLGVHTDKLKTAGIVSNNSSYTILKKLANNDLTYIGIKNTNKGFNIDSLFSEHIDHKIQIFNEILKVRSDDIYCIIKYCSDRTYTTGEEKENSDYFIIRKHNKYYSVLGIVKSDKINDYVPVTSRMYDNYEELKEFLTKVAKNQEITYPVNFQIENYENGYYAKGFPKLEEKIELNKILKDISDKFGSIPSTNRDFIAIIEKLLNTKQKSYNYNSILTLIRDDIKNKSIIDEEEVKELLDEDEIPSDLKLLIEACNDFMCSNCSNNEINNNYSSIQNENANLKKELETLKQELLKFKEENNELKEKNTTLEEDNNNYSRKLKVLTDAYKSII